MPSIPLHQTTDPLISPNFSRWVSLEFLLDVKEMQGLLEALDPLYLLSTTVIDKEDPFCLSKDKFLEVYKRYIESLKSGHAPDVKDFRPIFYGFWTRSLDDIYRQEVQAGKELLKIQKPFLQVQPISLNLSKVDHSIHVGPISPSGILWGLRVSFPQLIQNAGSADIDKIKPNENDNANLFKALRGYIREHTQPVTFLHDGKEMKTAIRLGKICMDWIHNHPDLQHNHLSVR